MKKFILCIFSIIFTIFIYTTSFAFPKKVDWRDQWTNIKLNDILKDNDVKSEIMNNNSEHYIVNVRRHEKGKNENNYITLIFNEFNEYREAIDIDNKAVQDKSGIFGILNDGPWMSNGTKTINISENETLSYRIISSYILLPVNSDNTNISDELWEFIISSTKSNPNPLNFLTVDYSDLSLMENQTNHQMKDANTSIIPIGIITYRKNKDEENSIDDEYLDRFESLINNLKNEYGIKTDNITPKPVHLYNSSKETKMPLYQYYNTYIQISESHGFQNVGYGIETHYMTNSRAKNIVEELAKLSEYSNTHGLVGKNDINKNNLEEWLWKDINGESHFNKADLVRIQQIFRLNLKDYIKDSSTTGFSEFMNSTLMNGQYIQVVKEAIESQYGKALTLGLSLSSLASFADNDYTGIIINALNNFGATQAGVELSGTDKDLRSILNTLLILSKFRKPLYMSQNKVNSYDTASIEPANLSALLNSEYVSLYIDTYSSNEYINEQRRTNILNTISNKTTKSDEENIIESDNTRVDEWLAEYDLLTSDNYDNSNLVRTYFSKYVNNTGYNNSGGTELGSTVLLKYNNILNVDKNGYKSNSTISSYINYLYLKQLRDNISFTSRSNLSSPLYIDAFGNIVTSENIMVFPAVSNSTIMSGYAPYIINTTLWNSKAFCDAFNSYIEIPEDAYRPLYNYFILRNEENDLDFIETKEKKYFGFLNFNVEKKNRKSYIKLQKYTIVDKIGGVSTPIELTADFYTKNEGAIIASSIYSFLTSKQQKPIIQIDDDNNAKTFTLYNNLFSDKVTPYDMYMRCVPFYSYLVLAGAKQNNLATYSKKLMQDMNFNVASLLIAKSADLYEENISKLVPHFMMDSDNIFSFSIKNYNAIDIIQILLTVTLWLGLFIITVKVVVSFSIKESIKIVVSYGISVAMLLLLVNIISVIQTATQNVLMRDGQKSLMLKSIVESNTDYRIGLTEYIPMSQSSARLKISSRDIDIKQIINSIVRLDNKYTLSKAYNEEIESNALRDAGEMLEVTTSGYYLNINRFASDIGFRYTSDGGVVYTRSENASLPNYYLVTNLIMESIASRLSDYTKYYNIVPSSVVDKKYNEEFPGINNTYGLASRYYELLTVYKRKLDDEYTDYMNSYDYTGLYQLVKPFFDDSSDIPKEEKYNTCLTYYLYKGTNVQGQRPQKIAYMDDGDIKPLDNNFKFNPINTQLLKDYNFQITEWGNYLSNNTSNDKIYLALNKANEAFYNTLAEVYGLSSSVLDKDIFLYCSISASIAFNEALNLSITQLDISDIDNAGIVNLLVGGINYIINSTGKTQTRYIFERDTSPLVCILNLICLILFDFVVLMKSFLLVILLLAFIYSIILQGVVNNNIIGTLLSAVYIVIFYCASCLAITVMSMLASLVSNLNIMLVANIVTLYFMIIFIGNLIRSIADSASDGGYSFATGVIKDLIGGVGGVAGMAALSLGAGALTGSEVAAESMKSGFNKYYGAVGSIENRLLKTKTDNTSDNDYSPNTKVIDVPSESKTSIKPIEVKEGKFELE